MPLINRTRARCECARMTTKITVTRPASATRLPRNDQTQPAITGQNQKDQIPGDDQAKSETGRLLNTVQFRGERMSTEHNERRRESARARDGSADQPDKPAFTAWMADANVVSRHLSLPAAGAPARPVPPGSAPSLRRRYRRYNARNPRRSNRQRPAPAGGSAAGSPVRAAGFFGRMSSAHGAWHLRMAVKKDSCGPISMADAIARHVAQPRRTGQIDGDCDHRTTPRCETDRPSAASHSRHDRLAWSDVGRSLISRMCQRRDLVKPHALSGRRL